MLDEGIRALAGLPKTARGAIALVALFSMLTSLISWGLSLIFGGLCVREPAHRVRGMDSRAAGAAAYLGLGAVWAANVLIWDTARSIQIKRKRFLPRAGSAWLPNSCATLLAAPAQIS